MFTAAFATKHPAVFSDTESSSHSCLEPLWHCTHLNWEPHWTPALLQESLVYIPGSVSVLNFSIPNPSTNSHPSTFSPGITTHMPVTQIWICINACTASDQTQHTLSLPLMKPFPYWSQYAKCGRGNCGRGSFKCTGISTRVQGTHPKNNDIISSNE